MGALRRMSLAAMAGIAAAGSMTCGDLKSFYADESQCCGNPSKVIKAPAGDCPYNFNKPACVDAEPQSPRDLTPNAPGDKVPKAATLNDAQGQALPLTNVHFHLGAEHKSINYANASETDAFDGRRLSGGAVRPGFM